MDPALQKAAEAARGFMPPAEGLALHDAAVAAVAVTGPFLEVGSYCGKSSVYLGAAAQATGRVLFAVDHHRGSEENQAGWEWHDAEVVDPRIGTMDTLPFFRAAIHDGRTRLASRIRTGERSTIVSTNRSDATDAARCW